MIFWLQMATEGQKASAIASEDARAFIDRSECCKHSEDRGYELQFAVWAQELAAQKAASARYCYARAMGYSF